MYCGSEMSDETGFCENRGKGYKMVSGNKVTKKPLIIGCSIGAVIFIGSEIKETVKVIEVNLTEEEYAFGVDKNKKDRKKYVTFSDEYYSASQRLVVGGDNTEFNSCGDKASEEKG